MGQSHTSLVREQFARQAPSFGAAGSAFSDRDLMEWIVGSVQLDPDLVVLDVAGGAGHLARALVPRVRRVVVIDVTAEMLAVGRRDAAAAGVDNVAFEQGDAAALPYPDSSFDLVACRFAVHHFPRPERPLAEMVRVCRPGGRVLVVDIVAAEPALAESYNRLERLRDPSHTAALSAPQLVDAIAQAGTEIVHRDRRDHVQDLEKWMAQTQTAARDAEAIRHALREELAAGRPTGMRSTIQEGRLQFTHRFELVVAEKPRAKPR